VDREFIILCLQILVILIDAIMDYLKETNKEMEVNNLKNGS
jgi:hypothetical protein